MTLPMTCPFLGVLNLIFSSPLSDIVSPCFHCEYEGVGNSAYLHFVQCASYFFGCLDGFLSNEVQVSVFFDVFLKFFFIGFMSFIECFFDFYRCIFIF